ncbi:hypothetical protein OVA14_02745 [Agrococcus sp. SL85]|uniref:hypothetical protein n=1 Tax=Agrococcus sp. SL85 TaxID=2995141 RepID=UPI00226C7144|nr:hypothetical protein [Agrococcus sp. SL85]WAC66713.1 hypothetical protein OVA14_02745 [Agrococcus sp. SL85]
MSWMDPSPKGRGIVVVEGDPQTIIRRGEEIEALGRMMSDSATILEGLAEGTDGLQGKAAAKLREGVGDVHGTLAEAGQLYTPTGPVVRRYGVALSEDQSAIAGHVALCEGLWETFRSLPGSVEPRGTGGWFEPEAGSEEAQQQADEDEAKRLAYEAWEDEARRFDADYDSWESAFEAAAADVGDAVAGKIEDSFWDDLDGFVAGALKVLQVVGLVLAVVGLVIGGPILAALGAIVAIATLVLTVYQFCRDDASGLDLALAIVGVIPFGSLGKLAQGRSGVVSVLGDVAGGAFKPSTYSAAVGQLRTLSMASRFAGGGAQGFRAGASAFLQLNSNGLGGTMTRLLTGKGVDDFAMLSNVLEPGTDWTTRLAVGVDFGHSYLGNAIKVANYGTQAAGTEGLADRFPALRWMGF